MAHRRDRSLAINRFAVETRFFIVYPGNRGRHLADWLTRKQRSRNMASIRSTGNKTTEVRFRELLRDAQISGWRRHLKLPGKPDFVFRKERVAIFIDGCFWHGCPRCYKMPGDNRRYWRTKVNANRCRDRKNAALLRSLGWRVMRVWEHSLESESGRKRVLLFVRKGLLLLPPPKQGVARGGWPGLSR
jgi:DNA mismatch endonuclease, patch repair protein